MIYADRLSIRRTRWPHDRVSGLAPLESYCDACGDLRFLSALEAWSPEPLTILLRCRDNCPEADRLRAKEAERRQEQVELIEEPDGSVRLTKRIFGGGTK